MGAGASLTIWAGDCPPEADEPLIIFAKLGAISQICTRSIPQIQFNTADLYRKLKKKKEKEKERKISSQSWRSKEIRRDTKGYEEIPLANYMPAELPQIICMYDTTDLSQSYRRLYVW